MLSRPRALASLKSVGLTDKVREVIRQVFSAAFGRASMKVEEWMEPPERVVWNESSAATRNGAPLVWQRVSDTLTSSMGMLVQHGDAEAY